MRRERREITQTDCGVYVTSLILLSPMDENRNCVYNGSHMQIQKYEFLQHKKHVLARSKKIVQLLYRNFIHVKYRNVHL